MRPAALRFKKAHVTHPELKATFQLDLIGVKKNPQVHRPARRLCGGRARPRVCARRAPG